MTKIRLKYVIPVTIGCIALFIPLIGNFHVDSAVLASLAGCFWAGWRAYDRNISRHTDFKKAISIYGYILLAGLPLLISDLILGCFSIHGLGFWIVFPLPGIFFGYAVGRFLRMWDIAYRRTWTVIILIAIAVGTTLFELFTYPQVYFFNHVWGGWPGPIYDEAVRLNVSAIYFRSLTVLWIILLWNIPLVKRDRLKAGIVIASVLALGIGYTQLNEMGVVSPRSYLQDVLGGSKETAHFKIYYDQSAYTDYEIDLLASEHEFYLDRISGILKVEKPDSNSKIESYLYAHPWQKKRLVGAKFTSYVPVWLKQDQLHIARQQLDSSLEHELVHIVAKSFGNKLFNASWSIGMIEGLAVAVAGGNALHTTIDQVVVSEKPYPSTEELQHTFSPLGFYGGRSGVNYTTSGSFVRFLLNEYPPENLTRAYSSANISEAYNTSLESLTKKWHSVLDTVATDTLDRQIASRIFGTPSLFEQDCPRVQTDFAQAWDRYRLYRAEEDTTKMLKTLNEALRYSDESTAVKSEWTFQHLVSGNINAVQNAVSLQDSSIELQLLYADAFALTGILETARRHYNRALTLFAVNPDSLFEPAIAVRSDSEQWNSYTAMRYKGQWLSESEFQNVYYHTKIRALERAIEEYDHRYLEIYNKQLIRQPVNVRYFNTYLDLIHYLGIRSEFSAAKSWITQLKSIRLRPRYLERLEKEEEWINFLEKLTADRENK